jgi:hypothetical protein
MVGGNNETGNGNHLRGQPEMVRLTEFLRHFKTYFCSLSLSQSGNNLIGRPGSSAPNVLWQKVERYIVHASVSHSVLEDYQFLAIQFNKQHSIICNEP